MIAADRRAHCRDARVLALDECAVSGGDEALHALRAERRRRATGDNVEQSWEVQDGQRVGVHAFAASSSRTIALIVPPSARPLNCGTTLPITAPMFAAPEAMAARTAARMSSALACAGR